MTAINTGMLKILVVAMGLLIVAGFVVIGVTVAKRLQGLASVAQSWDPLSLPLAANERLVGMTGVGERLALHIQSPEGARIVFVDGADGRKLGEILLDTQN